MTKIYLDMDDVLVDFKRGLEDFNIKCEEVYHDKPKSEWTAFQKKLDRAVVDCMNTPEFFLNLPMKDGAKKLWSTSNFYSMAYILTAYPQTCKDIPRVAAEKRTWISKNLEPISDKYFICCAREDKALFAVDRATLEPNILVDDMESNITAWNSQGGIGILYITAEQAIEELRNVIK